MYYDSIEERARAAAIAMRTARDGGTTSEKAEPAIRYATGTLELARQILEMEKRVIINPRDIDNRSLFDADLDWMTDFSRYIASYRHFYDQYDPPAQKG